METKQQKELRVRAMVKAQLANAIAAALKAEDEGASEEEVNGLKKYAELLAFTSIMIN
jgi:hypothetical protein